MGQETVLAVLGAVLQEVEPLFGWLEGGGSFSFRGETFHRGSFGEVEVIVGTTGLGKVNAAITAAALLESTLITRVWNVGCAGAFAGGPLRVGDVLVASHHFLGDEGVLTDGGNVSGTAIGIPVLTYEEREYFDSFPSHRLAREFLEEVPPGLYALEEGPGPSRAVQLGAGEQTGEPWADTNRIAGRYPGSVSRAKDDPGAGGTPFRLVCGPSLTVGMASGDAATAEARFRHYGAHAENMEGSAVAQACYRFGVPAVECRGISNMAGNRRKEEWRLGTALAHCHGILYNRLLRLAGADCARRPG